ALDDGSAGLRTSAAAILIGTPHSQPNSAFAQTLNVSAPRGSDTLARCRGRARARLNARRPGRPGLCPDRRPEKALCFSARPRISAFYGIMITMYWEVGGRHQTPHFHARYGE